MSKGSLRQRSKKRIAHALEFVKELATTVCGVRVMRVMRVKGYIDFYRLLGY